VIKNGYREEAIKTPIGTYLRIANGAAACEPAT
jgi:hypothetical protein